MYFNCYLCQMLVFDVSEFKFVSKSNRLFFIANEEVYKSTILLFALHKIKVARFEFFKKLRNDEG